MKSNKGFTLSEILVSLFVISVGLAALSTLALFGMSEFARTKSRIETETEAMKLQVLMTHYFGQAVKVQTGNPAVNGNIGGIRDFNYNSIVSPGPVGAANDFTLVASFLRDTGGRNNANVTAGVIGQYRESVIWWRRPSNTTAGVLFIYGDTDNLNPTFGTVNRPSYAHQYTTKMTELEFRRETVATGVSAVRVRATFRYFNPSVTRANARSWCPTGDFGVVAGCPAAPAQTYVDVQKAFRILLKNNVLRNASLTGVAGNTIPDRPLNGLYFFNPRLPVTWGM